MGEKTSNKHDLGGGHSIGWIGAGRMGFAMARRLLRAGADVAVYNRTRAKAEPLKAEGASIVDHPSELAARDIVFTMVSGPVSGNAKVVAASFSRRAGRPRTYRRCDRERNISCRRQEIAAASVYS